MMIRKIKIALNNTQAELGKIEHTDPSEKKKLYGIFNGTFTNVEIFPTDLLEKITSGYAYTTQHDRYRHSDFFICGQHLALDFDTEDYRSTFEYLLKNDFILDYATFLHTTPSHTAENPRCRVVFLLDKAIYDKDEYAELAVSLVEYFKGVDRKCKDPGRFFYGAKGADSKWVGNTLALEKASEILIEPHRARIELQKQRDAEQAKRRIVVSKGEVSDKILERHSASLLARVREALDGDKYTTLRDISATFGGYISGGYYEQFDAEQWLKNAIRQNAGNVESLSAADRNIEESVRFGMQNPLYFEERGGTDIIGQKKIIVPELDLVHPPLSEVQKLQVVDVILDREWKRFNENLNANGINVGFPKQITDHLMIGYREKSIDENGVIIPEAMTVPYYLNNEVIALEFRENDDIVTYSSDVGLYSVKPMFEETSSFGIIMPDSIGAIEYYLSGDGDGSVYGLPFVDIKLNLPDKDLYCIIDNDLNIEQLEYLDSLGVKFIKVRSVDDMRNALNRSEIETIATRGMKLESVL